MRKGKRRRGHTRHNVVIVHIPCAAIADRFGERAAEYGVADERRSKRAYPSRHVPVSQRSERRDGGAETVAGEPDATPRRQTAQKAANLVVQVIEPPSEPAMDMASRRGDRRVTGI